MAASEPLILLNFPENLELKLFVDYVSGRLGINIYYDEQAINQRVTIKSPAKVPQRSLLPLLQSVLQMKGLVLADSEQPGWKRIVPATGMLSAAHTAATTQPASDNAIVGATALTQVFALRYVEPAKLEAVIKPFLTTPGGNSIAYADQQLLIVTDYASAVQRVAGLVQLLDRPQRQVSTRFVPVKHVEAQQLAGQVSQMLAAQQKAQGMPTAGAAGAAAVEILAEPRTNQLALIGGEREVQQAAELAASLDVALDLRTELYSLRIISPERIDRLVREMIGASQARRAYQSAIDREGNLLIVTATDEVHKQVESLRDSLDSGEVQQQSPVRFYKLANTTAAEVLQTIQAIEGQQDLAELRVEGPGPATRQAPTGPREPSERMPAEPPSITPRPSVLPPGATERGQPLAPPAPLRTLRTAQATVTADANTNTIIVVAPPAIQQVYEDLIKRLDKRRPQVLIECTIVTLDTSGDFSLGVEVSYRGGADDTDIITFSSFGLSSVGKTKPPDGDLGALTLTPGIGFNGAIINADIADVVLRALAHSGRAEVVSAPRILVNDNTTGTLASVDEAPFTSVNASDTVATTSFAGYATAGTTVTVTPHISEEGEHLQLEYSITLNSFSGGGSAGIPPPRQSNTITSKVTIPDGSTIVVGGLNRRNYSKTKDAIPILGQVPLLDLLFSSRSSNDRNSTLFVFVRPVILRDDQFRDLKYLSGADARVAGVPQDLPDSEPLIMQ
ncbi:secretin N-terminal domain-containing protein [Fontivita pretiosa]|uniref:secretin N-terminal domain-containing protein n=1 Tax=Fontivita pretiosa TaxID=2989684 RepID=UPI003D185949